MLEYYISMSAHLNLPSLSARSEDRQVRSTENFSRFTRRIRQWIVIPICECVCCGREGGREEGRRGEKGGRRKKVQEEGKRFSTIRYYDKPSATTSFSQPHIWRPSFSAQRT